MKIIIDIADAEASEILQNYAAAKGWSGLSVEEIAAKAADVSAEQLTAVAVQGSHVKQKNEEDAALVAKYGPAVTGSVG